MTEEHKKLANFIKHTHLELRQNALERGSDEAWSAHLQDSDKLRQYAAAMRDLAVEHWEENAASGKTTNRIDWIVDYCRHYFLDPDTLRQLRDKELRLQRELATVAEPPAFSRFANPLRLLDVGSCYNAFGDNPLFEVLAIDIAPANDTVLKCDFLNVAMAESLAVSPSAEVTALPEHYFDVVLFSLLLEYLPSSEQRLAACRNAYRLLRPEGVLIVVTPDSRHVGANAKLMKTWRYALGFLGFNRIKYTKLAHISCMVFRRSLFPELAVRWSQLHKEPYMTEEIQIPQDRTTSTKETLTPGDVHRITPPRNTDEIREMFTMLP